jgi:hypothetical protein
MGTVPDRHVSRLKMRYALETLESEVSGGKPEENSGRALWN